MTAGEERGEHAGVAFPPPVVPLVLLAAGFLLRRIAPMRLMPEGVSAIAGPAMALLSFGIFVWAVRTLLVNQTSPSPHKPTKRVVADGPFRFSRNPIYLSMVLLLVGAALWANSGWFLLLTIPMVALLTWGVVWREERYLEKKFGDEYASYKSRVRRWI